MDDTTRDGNAILTNYDSCGYFISPESDGRELVVYIDITVQAYINASDPYEIGA
jgi:hypothetical protein